jgi:hypothetical protein
LARAREGLSAVVGFTTSVPTISMPRTTFDSFLGERGALPPPITAVKIDVEGHQNSVLRGMLTSSKPNAQGW